MLAPVALAFADASIVVLALPQVVVRLHTSVSHVVWVIIAYNAALIAGALAVRVLNPVGRVWPLLLGGLGLFGAASIGAGVAPSLTWLVIFRVAQGLGGGALLCASLPALADACRPGDSPKALWSSAAAVGAALGPTAGGVLTQVFDWRAIFIAQAPVAAASALALWRAGASSNVLSVEPDPIAGAHTATPGALGRVFANVALALLSAGLIGALFVVTILLINVWGYTPLAAAAVLTILPVVTLLLDRASAGRSFTLRAASGAVALAVGLLLLGAVSHRALGVALISLALCGAGLGLAVPALTDVAMARGGRVGDHPLSAVSLTVAARDAGLVVGLLILTPIFVNQISKAPARAEGPIVQEIVRNPVPVQVKLILGERLLQAEKTAPQTELPDLGPAFRAAARVAGPSSLPPLHRLHRTVQTLVINAATRAFRWPLLVCAIFAALVLPLLGLRRLAA
jgi:MFS family permease